MDKRIIVIRNDIRKQRVLAIIRETPVDPEHPFEIILQDHDDTRSLAQNRLMWYWFGVIRRHVLATQGKFFSKDQIHDFFCEMFLPKITEEIMGKIITRQQTTRDLKVKEFSELLNQIELYCFDTKELSLVLPRRDDLYYAAMGKAA